MSTPSIERIDQLRSTLAAVDLALAGRDGSRMTNVLGYRVRRNTLLPVSSLPDPSVTAPDMVGVNEYAGRGDRVYGTVLVDVETRRTIDLMPDQKADTSAARLAEQPGIAIVCRDRTPFFARGATRGAPQAVQVADQWHLWHNLGKATERAATDIAVAFAPHQHRLINHRRMRNRPRHRPGRRATDSPNEPAPGWLPSMANIGRASIQHNQQVRVDGRDPQAVLCSRECRTRTDSVVDLHLGGAHTIRRAGRPARHEEERAWGC
ncbi:transposase [Streptomyces sp. NPDC058108]|uniref:transposase n=1 Tax=Streptomyces sp. NPDC058108 TaxID=3346344 RepID=UPI0036E7937D